MRRQVPIGVLISGSGTNLQAIIDAIETKELDAKIQVVLSNRIDAYGLMRAKKHGIPVEVLDHKRFSNREAFDQAVVDILRTREVELVVLAGFMRLLSPVFVSGLFQPHHEHSPGIAAGISRTSCAKESRRARRALLRLHGSFCQRRMRRGSYHYSSRGSGVSRGYRGVPCLRILEQEHRIYPRAIQLYSEGRLRIEGRKVFVDDLAREENQVLVQPPLKR